MGEGLTEQELEIINLVSQIRACANPGNAAHILRSFKEDIAKQQRTLTIKTYKDESGEYDVSVVNKMRKAKIE